MPKTVILGFLLTPIMCLAAWADSQVAEARLLGVNQAGGEFGKAPGVFNKDYTFPGAKQFEYCQAKGLRIVRLPFRWERIQPKMMSPLDSAELARLDEVVAQARECDLKILFDMHNYARYGGEVIGTRAVPNAAFADVWLRLARHFEKEEAVWAYGIMNEPHGTKGLWPAAAQAAVDAIRMADMRHTILVGGEGWSGAHSWRKFNEDLLLKDPANKLIYEAHQYFDRNNSGSYKGSYDAERAHPNVGVDRLQPFIDWLETHRVQGFIGEFGVPDNDPRWLVVLDNALAEMQKHQIGGTYWAAGPWWKNYPLSLEPRDGDDRPQMAVLDYYLRPESRAAEKPWIAAAEAAEAKAQRMLEEDARLGRRVYDLRSRQESYHYTNEGSEYASVAVEDQGRQARKITFKHQGNPAWVGMGLFLVTLNCQGHEAFSLEVRAKHPCRLEIKAYDTAGKRYSAAYDVSTDWQTLAIPFTDLKADGESFAAAHPIQKIELQPSVSGEGNSLYLGALRLRPQP